MGDFIKLLRAYTEKHSMAPTDMQDIMDLYYVLYTDAYPIEDTEIRSGYEALEEMLKALPLADNNAVFHLVADLCERHSRRGFEAGVSVGCQATHYLYRFCGKDGSDGL